MSVPGYGPTFKTIGRSTMVESGRYALNLHRLAGTYEAMFPLKKGVVFPKNFSRLYMQEKEATDILSNAKYATSLDELAAPLREVFFESGLPSALIEPTDELIIASSEQMAQALTFYRDVLRGKVRGVYPMDYFADQMSAVSNLGLFGQTEDARFILDIATTNYGEFDIWKDYFLTRALLNLKAYEELKQLSQIRLQETVRLQRGEDPTPKMLAAVWTGVQQVAAQAGYKLNIPAQRILNKDEAVPTILQHDLLMHHPFNYILANSSVETTQQWLLLREGLDEQFAQAAQLAPAPLPKRPTPAPAAARPAPATPQTPTPAQLQQEVVTQLQQTSLDFTTPQQLESSSSVATTTPQTKKPKETAKQPKNTTVKQTFATSKYPVNTIHRGRRRLSPKQVYDELFAYMQQNGNTLPSVNTALRTAAYRVVSQGDPSNPDVQAVIELWKSHTRLSKPITRTAHNMLVQLKAYLAENNNQLPPKNSKLRMAVYSAMKHSDMADPETQALVQLWNAHLQQPGGRKLEQKSYNNLLQELENYLSRHGILPPSGTSLRKRVLYACKVGNPDDPNVQAMAELLKTHSLKTPRTPQVVRKELENYVLEHHGQLPPSGSPIRRRAEDIKSNGAIDDVDVQTIIHLLDKHAIQSKRNPQQLRQDFETYLQENNGAYPPNGSALNKAIQRVLRKYPTDEDPDVKTIRTLWNQHVKKIRSEAGQRLNHQKKPVLTSAQLREQLETYIAEHDGKIPLQHHPIRATAEYRLSLGETQDPDLIAIRDILVSQKKHYQKRTPAQVRSELETYLQKNNNVMPAHGSTLDQAVKAMIKKYPQDPNTQALVSIVEQHRQRKSVTPQIRSPKDLLEDLQLHLTREEFSPYQGALYQAIHKALRNGNPQDPDVIALNRLWTDNCSKTRRSPQQVKEELEKYLQQGHTSLTNNKPLYYATRNVLKTENPADPHVQAISKMWQALGLKIPTFEKEIEGK